MIQKLKRIFSSTPKVAETAEIQTIQIRGFVNTLSSRIAEGDFKKVKDPTGVPLICFNGLNLYPNSFLCIYYDTGYLGLTAHETQVLKAAWYRYEAREAEERKQKAIRVIATSLGISEEAAKAELDFARLFFQRDSAVSCLQQQHD